MWLADPSSVRLSLGTISVYNVADKSSLRFALAHISASKSAVRLKYKIMEASTNSQHNIISRQSMKIQKDVVGVHRGSIHMLSNM